MEASTPIALIQQRLRDYSDPIRAQFSPNYFKLEPGDTDQFLGVTVPNQRKIVKEFYQKISPREVEQLLHSTVHEERLTALLLWVLQYQKGDSKTKADIYSRYIKNTKWVNSWDLVDSTASYIVGPELFGGDDSMIDTLSRSTNMWERRIAIIATSYFIRNGEFAWTLKLAEQYLSDTHHYIQKATGWMLREVGKKDEAVLAAFLDDFAPQMPRTMLRYAIEKFDASTRAVYLAKKL